MTNTPSQLQQVAQLFTGLGDFVTSLAPLPLCMVMAWGIGFVLKRSPHVRNEIIPFVVIAVNAIGYALIGELGAGRHPGIRNFIIGMVAGIICWLLHYYRRSIPFVRDFVPASGNTQQFKKPE